MARKYALTLDRVMAAVECGDYVGFCLKCGAEQEGVEPDAERYECDECGQWAVYGAEEILLRNA